MFAIAFHLLWCMLCFTLCFSVKGFCAINYGSIFFSFLWFLSVVDFRIMTIIVINIVKFLLLFFLVSWTRSIMGNLSLLVVWFPMFFFALMLLLSYIFSSMTFSWNRNSKLYTFFFFLLDLCCHRRQRLYIDVHRNECVLLTTRAKHRFVPAFLAEIESTWIEMQPNLTNVTKEHWFFACFLSHFLFFISLHVLQTNCVTSKLFEFGTRSSVFTHQILEKTFSKDGPAVVATKEITRIKLHKILRLMVFTLLLSSKHIHKTDVWTHWPPITYNKTMRMSEWSRLYRWLCIAVVASVFLRMSTEYI